MHETLPNWINCAHSGTLTTRKQVSKYLGSAELLTSMSLTFVPHQVFILNGKTKANISRGCLASISLHLSTSPVSYLIPYSLSPILLLLALLIQVHGDRALCEAHGELQSRPTLHYEKYDFCSTATLLIKLVRVGADWKIISFECIYNTDNIVPLFEDHQTSRYPTLTCPRESYRHLHYVVEKTQGYKLDGNLPGWDRPKEALILLEQARKWTVQNGK